MKSRLYFLSGSLLMTLISLVTAITIESDILTVVQLLIITCAGLILSSIALMMLCIKAISNRRATSARSI